MAKNPSILDTNTVFPKASAKNTGGLYGSLNINPTAAGLTPTSTTTQTPTDTTAPVPQTTVPQFNTVVPKTITSSVLKPVENPFIPTNPVVSPIDTSSVMSDINSGVSQAQAQVDALNRQGVSESNEISTLLESFGLKQGDINQQYQDTGVTNLFNQLTDLQAQAQALNLEAQAIPIQTQERNANVGASDAGVAPQATEALRRNALKGLSLGQQYAIASGNYEKAKNYADQIIDAKYAKIDAEIKARQQNLLALDKYELTPAQEKLKTAQLAEQARIQAENDARKEAEKRNYDKASQYALLASQNGQRDLAGSLSAIDPSSPTFNSEVSKLIGQVSDPRLKLDIQLKQAQIAKEQREAQAFANATVKGAEEKIKEGEAAKRTATNLTASLQGKIDLLDGALSSGAIDSLVGTNFFTRGGILGLGSIKDKYITGQTANLLGTIEQITGKAFLDEVAALKERGGTLGALNEKEGEKLAAAATKLTSNAWVVRDRLSGEITGYRVSEEEFKNELTTLRNAAARIQLYAKADAGLILNEAEKNLLDQAYADAGFSAGAFYGN